MNLHDSKQELGTTEIFVFTYCSCITLGVIFLPYVGGEEIRSAWLKLILAVIPFIILVGFIHMALKKQERGDLLELFREKTFAVFYIPLFLYLFLSSLVTAHWGIETLLIIVQTYLLVHTPVWVIVGYFIVVIFLSIIYGIEAITKLLVVLFVLDATVFFSLFFFMFSEEFQWFYVPPVFSVDAVTFLKSSLSDISRYGGVVALIGILPYMKNEVPFFKVTSISLLFVMLTFSLLSLVVLGTFGFEQALTLLSPYTSLIQAVTGGTGIFERLDLIFLSAWLASFYKISIIHFWFSSFLLKKLIPPLKKKDVLTKLFIVTTVFVVTIFTPGYVQFHIEPLNINLLFYSLVVPSMICLFLIVSKRGEKSNETN